MEAFRHYLKKLEENKELKRFSAPLSVQYEIAAVMQKLEKEQGPAALFTNIPQFKDWSLVGNLYASIKRLALGLNLPYGTAFKPTLLKRCSQLTRDVEDQKTNIFEKSAPLQEKRYFKNIDLPKLLPAPFHCVRDSGPFITAGVVIAKNPLTDKIGMQVIMMEVKSGNRLIISPVTPPIDSFYKQAEEMNKPLEVAVVIGVEPAFMFAACSPPLFLGEDKFALSATLRGSPIPLAPCETINLEVPAGAELVLEGIVIPHEREKMGPWGNYLKTYSWSDEKPVMEVRCVRHRTDPVFQDILANGRETIVLMALPAEVILYQEITASFPNVQDVHISIESCGLQAIISLLSNDGANFREIIEFVLSRFLIKSCILVDPDIDIYDPADVAWALATRVQARRDLIILSGMDALPLDPSAAQGKTDKWGINATKDPISHLERFQKADLPTEIKDKIASEWKHVLGT
jgi:2,5-furandicarboxylate decarboxylase 1